MSGVRSVCVSVCMFIEMSVCGVSVQCFIKNLKCDNCVYYSVNSHLQMIQSNTFQKHIPFAVFCREFTD
jgi:hypothetical protein